MSEKSLQKKSDEIHKIVQRIKQYKTDITKNFLLMGKDLDWASKDGRWSALASHIERWEDFLQEIGVAYSTAQHSINAFNIFGSFINALELPSERRIIRLIPIARGKSDDEKEELLIKAREITRSIDFEDVIREAKGEMTTDKCSHDEVRRTYYIMEKCGDCKKILSLKKIEK